MPPGRAHPDRGVLIVASVCKERDGTKRIAFVDLEGRHRSLRLGQCSLKVAETTRTRVEQLLQDRRFGVPHSPAIAQWLQQLPSSMHERLVRVGLVDGRTKAITLEELVERFFRTQTVKPATLAAYKQCTDSLLVHLGKDTPIDKIAPSDADGWRSAIAKSGRVREKKGPRSLSGATVAKRVNIAKAIFSKAKAWKLVPDSPFAHLKSGSQVNPARSRYVSPEDTQKLLTACPDAEWKVIVGLARFAGLRCPSEIRELRWADVDWANKKLLVRSPKTAAMANHAVRTVPVCPALQPLIWQLRQQSPAEQERIVPLLQDPGYNLRTRFQAIVRRAGFKPWPRLFHNLRASCTTDFAQALPQHEAARFLGQSPVIAASHYLQPRDHNFRAVTGDAPWATGETISKTGVLSGVQLAYKSA